MILWFALNFTCLRKEMDNYEFQDSVGEGTYGKVFKARVKSNGRIVAIKRFKESDEDEQVSSNLLYNYY